MICGNFLGWVFIGVVVFLCVSLERAGRTLVEIMQSRFFFSLSLVLCFRSVDAIVSYLVYLNCLYFFFSFYMSSRIPIA